MKNRMTVRVQWRKRMKGKPEQRDGLYRVSVIQLREGHKFISRAWSERIVSKSGLSHDAVMGIFITGQKLWEKKGES